MEFSMFARTTVICAVWNADPNRWALLKGHEENLDRQTTPLERIYVLDNGDSASIPLKGLFLSSDHKLTIYEAWKHGLSRVKTPFVMNLNLDDRLASDAIEKMEAELDEGGDLVGGDWMVCHSQSETDFVVDCRPARSIPYDPNWPPVKQPQSSTRLGSGTGARGTFGPACLWRMSLHQEIGQFPTQLGNGYPISVIGDSVWWQILEAHGKKLVRLPLIVGNYHSHPDTQAEFRGDVAEERRIASKYGVRIDPGR